MNNPVIDCPFDACTAQVEVIIEQAYPGDDETTRRRVPEHPLEPRSTPDYGACPASLMALPLGEHETEALRQASAGVAMWRDGARRQAEAVTPDERSDQPPRGRKGSDKWFRAAQCGDNPTGESGPKGYNRMPVGYLPGTDMGGSVPTVGEVRSAIERMQHLAAEAQGAAQVAGGKFAEAEALAAWIREGTTDDVGHAQLLAAKEACTQAENLAHQAIDIAGAYGSTL